MPTAEPGNPNHSRGGDNADLIVSVADRARPATDHLKPDRIAVGAPDREVRDIPERTIGGVELAQRMFRLVQADRESAGCTVHLDFMARVSFGHIPVAVHSRCGTRTRRPTG